MVVVLLKVEDLTITNLQVLTNKDMENNDGEIFMKENSISKFLSDKANCSWSNISESCSM